MSDINMTVKIELTFEAVYRQTAEVEVPAYKAARIKHKLKNLRGFAREDYVETIMAELDVREEWGEYLEWEVEIDSIEPDVDGIDMSDDDVYFETNGDSML